MIISKAVYCTVDLVTPEDLYYPDKKELVREILNKKYVGKCCFEMYITDIVEITNMTETFISQETNDGCGYIEVHFIVKGVRITVGEIIHGCTVTKIYPNNIIATVDNCQIMCWSQKKRDSIYDIISVNSEISVVVIKSSYNISCKYISVIADIYYPKHEPLTFFRISEPIKDSEVNDIRDLIEQINSELSSHSTIKDTATYKHFKKVLFPYDEKVKFDGIPDESFDSINIDRLLEEKERNKLSSGYIIYPSTDFNNRERFWHAENMTKIPRECYVAKAFNIVFNIASKYLYHLKSLRGLVEKYPTPSSASHMQSYFGYFIIAKKENTKLLNNSEEDNNLYLSSEEFSDYEFVDDDDEKTSKKTVGSVNDNDDVDAEIDQPSKNKGTNKISAKKSTKVSATKKKTKSS